MSRINLFVAQALLIIAVTVLCVAQKRKDVARKRWPDFSCHQSNKGNAGISGSINAAQHFWNLCVDEEEEKGACAKICVLVVEEALYRMDDPNDPINPVIFEVDGFVTALSEQLGYYGTSSNMGLRNKVRSEMEECKKKFPDLNHLNISSSCEPWKEVLDCIDKAYGCVDGTPSSK